MAKKKKKKYGKLVKMNCGGKRSGCYFTKLPYDKHMVKLAA